MAGGTRIPVLVGERAGSAFIKPVGACTMAIAGLVRKHVDGLRRPDTTALYFDLSQASAIDSTFTGLLLSLVTFKADASVPAVHLVAPSGEVVEALERMYVLRLFDVCTALPDPPPEWRELAGQSTDRAQLTDLVIDTHQQLIDADPRNAKPFTRVVEGLKRSHPDKTDT